jgi:hypothetical protein
MLGATWLALDRFGVIFIPCMCECMITQLMRRGGREIAASGCCCQHGFVNWSSFLRRVHWSGVPRTMDLVPQAVEYWIHASISLHDYVQGSSVVACP